MRWGSWKKRGEILANSRRKDEFKEMAAQPLGGGQGCTCKVPRAGENGGCESPACPIPPSRTLSPPQHLPAGRW